MPKIKAAPAAGKNPALADEGTQQQQQHRILVGQGRCYTNTSKERFGERVDTHTNSGKKREILVENPEKIGNEREEKESEHFLRFFHELSTQIEQKFRESILVRVLQKFRKRLKHTGKDCVCFGLCHALENSLLDDVKKDSTK